MGLRKKNINFQLRGHTNSINALVVTSDSRQVVSASKDKSIKLWNLATKKEVLSLTGHTQTVNDLAVTSEGKMLISVSSDRTLKVWNLVNGEIITNFYGDGALTCCAIAPDGVTIVAGEASGRVHFLRLEGV